MFLLQLQLLLVIVPKKSRSEFRWTDDELGLLPKCCADFKKQERISRDKLERYKKQVRENKKKFS